MKTTLTKFFTVGLGVIAALCVGRVALSSSSPATQPISPSTLIRANIVSMLRGQPNIPIKPLSDIPGGAPRANNKDAAYYAWQEFIALNWANVPVTGLAPTVGSPGARETADRTKKFGQPAQGSSTNYPALVWESTRARSEIYTGTSTPPSGYSSSSTNSWGYNSSPGYVYPGISITQSSTPSNCTSIKAGFTPFINLDEASEIGTCTMYAGLPYSQSGPTNFVFFMAKGSLNEYGYIASRGWYNTSLLKNPASPGTPTNPVASFANTSGYIVTQGKLPTPGAVDGSKAPGSNISFPNDTLEFKAAFRVATDQERTAYEQGQPIPGGYHVAPVRYYQEVNGAFQYVDTCGVLLSLHIIHKTASAPYFIFATFEHTKDVVGTDGNPTEDNNGTLQPNAFTTAAPTPVPSPFVLPSSGTAPAGQYLVSATSPNVVEYPSQYNKANNTVSVQSFMPGPNDQGGVISPTQSSYINVNHGGTSTLPASNASPSTNRYITVNRRRYSIPQNPIIQVNQDIHNLISQYGFGGANNTWMNYKLVNVQWVPAGNVNQKTPGQLYGGATIPVESYYLSNSLVETNMILSAFSGQFGPATATADGFSITDFYYNPTTYTNNNIYVGGKPQTKTINVGSPFYNIYTPGGPYNMGGCMGCHGNAQVAGADMSFILKGAPFTPEGPQPGVESMTQRFKSFFSK